MLSGWRKRTVIVAMGALVVAGCYAPKLALAAHHPAMAHYAAAVLAPDHSAHSHADHADHHAEKADCHGQTTVDADGNYAGESKYCCAAACTATVFILADSPSIVRLIVSAGTSISLDDALRSFNIAAVDPPPRLI